MKLVYNKSTRSFANFLDEHKDAYPEKDYIVRFRGYKKSDLHNYDEMIKARTKREAESKIKENYVVEEFHDVFPVEK